MEYVARVIARHLSTVIQPRFQDHPTYRPININKDARRDEGVKISYSTAWRAKEQTLANINGSHEEAYIQLPQYCEDILHANPGSNVTLDRTGENRFLRVFVCYGASARGFGDCRPILGLDGVHLKGRFLGVLLSATAVDANGSLFPLAHAVVNAEDDDNWL